jgi:uncharacterized protein YlxW (UPF0749 family)
VPLRRPRLRVPALLVTLTAAAAGLLFATSATTADGTDLRADRRLQLAELIARERSEVTRREQAAAVLRSQVEDRRAEAAARDVRVAQEEARAAQLAVAAGTTAVTGPGLTVSLDDAPPGATSEEPDDLVVHQQDVQAVVNALWAGGAEAMTLMGQRVISTSAVRCVGNTVVLHGQVYGPPFVVTAVGDRTAMRAALDTEPGVELFLRYVDRFGLGYDVTSADEVQLPAYEGPLDLPSVTAAG